jgi:hypothetical protein
MYRWQTGSQAVRQSGSQAVRQSGSQAVRQSGSAADVQVADRCLEDHQAVKGILAQLDAMIVTDPNFDALLHQAMTVRILSSMGFHSLAGFPMADTSIGSQVCTAAQFECAQFESATIPRYGSNWDLGPLRESVLTHSMQHCW